MTGRKEIYDSLKLKMEDVGFQFEKEQKPHLQNRKEIEIYSSSINRKIKTGEIRGYFVQILCK